METNGQFCRKQIGISVLIEINFPDPTRPMAGYVSPVCPVFCCLWLALAVALASDCGY